MSGAVRSSTVTYCSAAPCNLEQMSRDCAPEFPVHGKYREFSVLRPEGAIRPQIARGEFQWFRGNPLYAREQEFLAQQESQSRSGKRQTNRRQGCFVSAAGMECRIGAAPGRSRSSGRTSESRQPRTFQRPKTDARFKPLSSVHPLAERLAVADLVPGRRSQGRQ